MKNKKILYLLPSLIYALLIFIVSGLENISITDIGLNLSDKILHFSAYLLFGLTLYFSIKGYKSDISLINQFILLFTIGSVYALSDEIHQFFVPGRTCDFIDLAADILGIIVSFFVYRLIYKTIKSRRASIV